LSFHLAYDRLVFNGLLSLLFIWGTFKKRNYPLISPCCLLWTVDYSSNLLATGSWQLSWQLLGNGPGRPPGRGRPWPLYLCRPPGWRLGLGSSSELEPSTPRATPTAVERTRWCQGPPGLRTLGLPPTATPCHAHAITRYRDPGLGGSTSVLRPIPPGDGPGRLVRSSGRAFIRWRRPYFRSRARVRGPVIAVCGLDLLMLKPMAVSGAGLTGWENPPRFPPLLLHGLSAASELFLPLSSNVAGIGFNRKA
jgi:hypothetical protein